MKNLDNPPYVHNWVRYNYPDLAKTTEGIVRFGRSIPQYTYQHAMKLLGDRLNLGVGWETLLTSAATEGRANSRALCVELLEAFRMFEEQHDLVGRRSYDFEVLPFKVSKNVRVPVRPLTSIVQGGRLEPVFVFGWASFPLTHFQIRLLMTVIEDAVFSLEDYSASKGHFLILPRDSNDGIRRAKVWHRGDYDLLSDIELRSQIDIFMEALEAAKGILAVDPRPQKEDRSDRNPDPNQFELPI